MRLEIKFLIVAAVAIALSVPTAIMLHRRAGQVQQAGAQTKTLRLQLKATEKQLQLKNTQLQKKTDENKDLQNQLQTKLDNQAKLASTTAHSAPVFNNGNCNDYTGLVAQYDWDTRTALAIMHAESTCDPTAASSTCDHGLMQINCVHADLVGGDLAALNDPATNIRVAYQVYSARGSWSDWTTFTSGAYLRYL